MEDKPIFIVGCSRSGTTLLRLMMTHHPDLHIPPESEFLLSLHERVHEYGKFKKPNQRWFFIRDLQRTEVSMNAYAFSIFDLSVREAEHAIAEEAPTDFAGAAAALFRASAQKHGKTRWGDKTPHYVRHLNWLADAYPEAQFVHLIRDGRDVARSRLEAGFPANIRSSAKHWREEVQKGRWSGASLSSERYIELHYENLVEDPESVLKNLCQWTNLQYNTQMLQYHQSGKDSIPDEHSHLHENINNPVDSSRAQAWKRSLSKREIADVEDVAGDLLEELGYNRTGARVPLWLRGLRFIYRRTLPLTGFFIEKLKRLGLD